MQDEEKRTADRIVGELCGTLSRARSAHGLSAEGMLYALRAALVGGVQATLRLPDADPEVSGEQIRGMIQDLGPLIPADTRELEERITRILDPQLTMQVTTRRTLVAVVLNVIQKAEASCCDSLSSGG